MSDTADADQTYAPSLSSVLEALNDSTRRQIVRRLFLNPGLCNSFSDLGSKTRLSYHFAVLRRAGLTRTERQGTWRLMHLRYAEVEESLPGLLKAVLQDGASENE